MKTDLIAAQIELTNACKLACAECPRHLMSRPVGVMKLDLAKTIILDGIEYNPKIGFNVNGLGEPLLYPWFSEVVEFMAGSGAQHLELFTSLVAAPRQIEKAFAAIDQSKIHTQLAITKHLYDNQGRRQFDDASFDAALEQALGMGDHVEKHIAVVLTKYHTADDVQEFESKYLHRFQSGNFHIIRSLNPWFNLVKDMAHPGFGAIGDAMEPNICDYPFILLHVGWNGDVIVCCTDDVDGECILGKIEQRGDLRKVWHGEVMEELRRKHRAYIIDMPPCTKCGRTAWARKKEEASLCS